MSAGSAPIRFGLIGVDSPHAPSFTSLFGDGIDGAVPGGTVTHAWKGEAAADFPLSFERIDGFEQQVIDLGVSMCASPEEVAQVCDALLIVASDTRTHRAYFDRVVGFGKPIYVDTRFATTLDDARSMLAAAQASGALVLAGSPKRFTPEFASAVAAGPAERISLTGPLPTQPGHPGLAWYGVHLVDLAVTALGADTDLAGAVIESSRDEAGGRTRVTIRCVDGRVIDLGGEDQWSAFTAGVLERADSNAEFSIEAGPPMLVGLLEGLVASCLGGTPNVPPADILGIVAIVQAANQSLDTGRPVSLGSLT
ncbi:gfo/Idh/MocA family oxidoreductase [Paeniglutamicibacter kerguelensis]|uniref:Dehydrogenase n=1 Tax=Paeniglutamicibacter kerguelensis TaxID=254788 RepID=A0ABS4XHB0_9MICC|nr:gfo/Idh/MocA family oxidoreductase [Paeniglutamicibacter kerguelensis]MBP2387862.1 putative dehydrogenase [Paeniglutamicibacter kerguelensis]